MPVPSVPYPSAPYPYAWGPPPRRATAGSVLSGMFDVWVKGFKDFFLVFLVLGLGTGLLGSLLTYAVLGTFVPPTGFVPGSPPSGVTSANLVTLLVFAVVLAIVGIVLSAIVGGGMTEYSVRRVRGEAITLEQALRRGLEKFLSILGASLLLGLLVFAVILIPLLLLLPLAFAGPAFDPTSGLALICGALALFVVGGVFALYIGVRMSLYAPAIMIENTNAVGGLKRSWAIMKGHWWSLFLPLLAATILASIVNTAITTPAGVLRNPILSIVAAAISSAITGAWSIIVAAVAYDLIVRERMLVPPAAPPYYAGPATGTPPGTAQGPPSPPPPAPPRGP